MIAISDSDKAADPVSNTLSRVASKGTTFVTGRGADLRPKGPSIWIDERS
jgi:hypothetical protein